MGAIDHQVYKTGVSVWEVKMQNLFGFWSVDAGRKPSQNGLMEGFANVACAQKFGEVVGAPCCKCLIDDK
jgi:hypothetical protein